MPVERGSSCALGLDSARVNQMRAESSRFS